DLNVCLHTKKDGISRCEYLIHPVSAIACLSSWPPRIHTPRSLEATTTFFASDRYGMLEAWKHITWFIHCSRADKWPETNARKWMCLRSTGDRAMRAIERVL